MGQIITSLINFFLEVGQSGDQYKTQKSRLRGIHLIVLGVCVILGITAFNSFSSAYNSKVEVIKLRAQLAAMDKYRIENDTLRIRNEILSSALSRYLGSQVVDQINEEKQSGLKDTLKHQQENPAAKLVIP